MEQVPRDERGRIKPECCGICASYLEMEYCNLLETIYICSSYVCRSKHFVDDDDVIVVVQAMMEDVIDD